MVTILFDRNKTSHRQFACPGATFSQDYFLAMVMPGLPSETMNARRTIRTNGMVAHMDSSMSRLGIRRSTATRKDLTRAPHPVPAPELARCGFWFFNTESNQ
jgi:hypothetical protein